MPAKIEKVVDAKDKRGGEVTALCFDGEHLYSGSEDGAIAVRKKECNYCSKLFEVFVILTNLV